jgi:hypothetical protein
MDLDFVYKVEFKTKGLVYRDCDEGVDQVVQSEWRELDPYYDKDTAVEVSVALINIGVRAHIVELNRFEVKRRKAIEEIGHAYIEMYSNLKTARL